MKRLTASAQDLEIAAEILLEGGLVAFPTETVYGLGARADQAQAVQRIFEAKGRPADHPLIVHLAQKEWLPLWAADVPTEAWTLAERFWPGPLTLILPKHESVTEVVTGGQPTIGLRVPKHPVGLDILDRVGVGLAAPSANRFGHVSATTADHVEHDFEGTIDAVVDGGPCAIGLESSIVDLSGEEPKLLRLGALSQREIEDALGRRLGEPTHKAPRVPGALASHYATKTPLTLVATESLTDAIEQHSGTLCVLSAVHPEAASAQLHWIEMPVTPKAYARVLYDSLRRADRVDAESIFVACPGAGPDWSAILDRLTRASD
jgi:L-threonylcarbamoyladenylate synthase